MSESSSSSQSSSSRGKVRKVEISIRTGEVKQLGEETEYARGQYMTSLLSNPIQQSEQETYVEYYDKCDNNRYALKIITSTMHENILRCFHYETVVHGDSKYYKALLEPFSGSLINIFEKRFRVLSIGNPEPSAVKYYPSGHFTHIIRNIVEVLCFLHELGMYHGALSWKTLFYKDIDGDYVVKLANFCKKDGVAIYQAQYEDWLAVASMLTEVHNKVINDHRCFKRHLVRARDFFSNVLMDQQYMRNIPNLIQDLDFFWGPQDRRTYAVKIHHWCQDENCRLILEHNANINVRLPWNQFKDDVETGIAWLAAMNNFKDRKGKNKQNIDYNLRSKVDLLKFISGLYAHCRTLYERNCGLGAVDNFICKNFPNIFYELRITQAQYNFV